LNMCRNVVISPVIRGPIILTIITRLVRGWWLPVRGQPPTTTQ
jgi:hypothetical protein